MQSPSEEIQTVPKQPIFNLHWIVPVIIGLMVLVHFLRVSIFADATNYPLTYSFLHADWAHVIMNSFWLLAFGGVTARRLGALRFVILFAIGAIGGAALHYIFHGDDISPFRKQF